MLDPVDSEIVPATHSLLKEFTGEVAKPGLRCSEGLFQLPLAGHVQARVISVGPIAPSTASFDFVLQRGDVSRCRTATSPDETGTHLEPADPLIRFSDVGVKTVRQLGPYTAPEQFRSRRTIQQHGSSPRQQRIQRYRSHRRIVRVPGPSRSCPE
jgi:hypothetical protein